MNKLKKQMWHKVAKKLKTSPAILHYEGWDWLDILDMHTCFFGRQQNEIKKN